MGTDSNSEPDLSVSIAEMLAIRESVRRKLVRQLHAYRMTARLYRNVKNYAAAEADDERARELQTMIEGISTHGIPPLCESIRLTD